eukprot:1307054-Pleurochrysis_carterae.AAC.1
MRGTLGTYTLYAPGEVRLWPRLMPTQARGSMRVFRVCDARFDGKCAASEREYGHDTWFCARQGLIGGQGATRRP